MPEQCRLFPKLLGARIAGIGTENMECLKEIHVKTDDGKFMVITGQMHVEEVE